MLSVSAVRQNLTLLSLKDENLFFLFTFAIACLPISADMLQAVVVTSPKPTFNFKWRTRQTLWRAVQMLTQKLCCQTIHDCPKVVPLHYESEWQ